MTGLEKLFSTLPESPSAKQLAAVFGVETQTVYIWLRRGVLPAYKLNNSWLIVRDDVVEHLKAQRNHRPGDPDAPPVLTAAIEQER